MSIHKKRLWKNFCLNFGIFDSEESPLQIRVSKKLSKRSKTSKEKRMMQNRAIKVENQMKSIVDDLYETLMINWDSFDSQIG